VPPRLFFIENITWFFSKDLLTIFVDTTVEVSLWMTWSYIEPFYSTKYNSRYGFQWPCGVRLRFDPMGTINAVGFGHRFRHTLVFPFPIVGRTIYFFLKGNLFTGLSSSAWGPFEIFVPRSVAPFWESWDEGLLVTYPWDIYAGGVRRVAIVQESLEIGTEGWAWGPVQCYLTLTAPAENPSLPMSLPRYLLAHHLPGLIRTPYYAAIEITLEPIFGRTYHLRFCLEWAFGDREYAYLYYRQYKKVNYGELEIHLWEEWEQLMDHYGLPWYTPDPQVRNIRVRTDISGSYVHYTPHFRQAYFGLFDVIPPGWPPLSET